VKDENVKEKQISSMKKQKESTEEGSRSKPKSSSKIVHNYSVKKYSKKLNFNKNNTNLNENIKIDNITMNLQDEKL